jgi:hypothetical protein
VGKADNHPRSMRGLSLFGAEDHQMDVAARYANPITADDLKHYRDAGVEEVALLALGRPRTEWDVIAGLDAGENYAAV